MRKFQSLVVPLIVAFLVSGCAGFGAQRSEPTPAPVVDLAPPQVIADARILPSRSADLRFLSSGSVAEILVAEGDLVTQGTPLARLDARELELTVNQARAQLGEAEAAYAQVAAGATPEEIAAAQVVITQAEADAQRVAGSVTQQDITAAREELRSAREALARLEAGPKSTEIAQAQANLDQAQTQLQSQRDLLSQAKTDAELRMSQAANTIRERQVAYSAAYWDHEHVTRHNTDPRSGRPLSDAEKRDYADALERARLALTDAEATLERIRLELEQARQAEINGLAVAEAQVRDAQARLDQLLAGADSDDLAAARARVAQVQATLARLTGEERAGQIAAAQAGIEQARANLEVVSAGPRTSDLALAQARIRTSEVSLKQAQLALDRATLQAPFTGTVVEINLSVGELPDPLSPAIVLADLSAWYIETSDLTELDIVAIRPGDSVTITFDAIPELALDGVVTRIKGLGKTFQGDVLYTVVIEPTNWDDRLRWNMTATVAIGG